MFLTQSVQNNISKLNETLIKNKKHPSLLQRFAGGLIDSVLLSSIAIIIVTLFHLQEETAKNYFYPALINIYNIYYMSSEK